MRESKTVCVCSIVLTMSEQSYISRLYLANRCRLLQTLYFRQNAKTFKYMRFIVVTEKKQIRKRQKSCF